MSQSAFERINDIIAASDVHLFMKGTPAAPQCGFSGAVVQVLNQLGIPFASTNVLADLEIREGIKAFSNWPTIPQLYIKGEFVGGCDIVREMAQSGELTGLLSERSVSPAVSETDPSAAKAKFHRSSPDF
ncbi:Grx4 family monothiol glutaredoxin [Roseibium litorale]|uniref:Grx4 family monothiol glutaredoxin n=1 Tax=Roseibium litorale TaxID=2803841 RepID=A0ABR9CSD3_9HYPH|nr:Grx4 family monothiol glutaredoxin [Roseibium litorale]MBD8893320.1 Grx4 family monothiol glutaredoxin [Roseibium litorale]